MSDVQRSEISDRSAALPPLAGIAVSIAPMLIMMALYFSFQAPINDFIRAVLGGARHDHIALPITALIFTITAYFGAPQIVLISACVLAFGAADGFLYAWIATIISGAVTFQHGRVAGAGALNRLVGSTDVLRYLGKNGFLASLLARFIPGPPFIAVNAGLGAANVGFWPFLLGVALGALPKTAIVAFAGNGVFNALEGDLLTAALMAGLAIALFVFGAVFLKRIAARRVIAARTDESTPP